MKIVLYIKTDKRQPIQYFCQFRTHPLFAYFFTYFTLSFMNCITFKNYGEAVTFNIYTMKSFNGCKQNWYSSPFLQLNKKKCKD